MAKILIVDDEPNIRLLYATILTEGGHEVVEAEDGHQTLKALESEPFDLVILDIRLKAESGLDLLREIAARYPQIPVIICSAYASFQDDYTSWLAHSYCVKSTDPRALMEEVERVLAQRTAPRTRDAGS
ncbi:MAG: response regulator [Blastocatellia bacterium]|nr:response regulator [Blastocatellia bacterium]MCS7157418.1 response regulator [Blastocatellia bacterium]MCX7752592.1 response regulator [Blastocatellia bacterium]MDW8168323.1 response regulator [Acidobacteriota bacterium]MDW8255519.1 response regulator [Acidobacteriota bacterium]